MNQMDKATAKAEALQNAGLACEGCGGYGSTVTDLQNNEVEPCEGCGGSGEKNGELDASPLVPEPWPSQQELDDLDMYRALLLVRKRFPLSLYAEDFLTNYERGNG